MIAARIIPPVPVIGARIDFTLDDTIRLATVCAILRQRLDSGEMVIQAVTGKSLLHLAWSWFATLFKLRSRAQTVTEWRGTRMTLDARPRQKISIDGEIAARTPVKVEVAKGAIEVAAPRD